MTRILSIKYCRLILEQFLARIWDPEYYSVILESKNTFHSYLLFDLKTVGQKSGRRVLIQHNTALFWKNFEPKEKSRNIFYLISKMPCNKSGSRRVLIQHNTALFWKKLEPKEKSRNIFYLISKMSCNKSGSRRVPIQHYFEENWNRKKNHWIFSIWSAKCPATNLAAGEY